MDDERPQINVSSIKVGGGIAGAVVALGGMGIFFVGIPLVRGFFVFAVVVGLVVALVIHFTRRERSSTSRILSIGK